MDLNESPSDLLAALPTGPIPTDEDIDDEFHLMNLGDLDFTEINQLLDMFRYEAFPVLEFRKKIKQKISQKDLVFLVTMFLRDTRRINRTCQVKLQNLTRKFNIKKRANGNNQVITLFRIAQSLPDVVALILDKYPNIAGPLTLAQMRLHSEYPEFPALAIQPLLACLLPKTHKESSNILNVFFFSNMMVSETFNKNSETWGNKTPQQRAIEIKTKQENHFYSRVFNEDLRKEWCTHLKILVDNEYSTVWMEAATKSKEKLMETYGISC